MYFHTAIMEHSYTSPRILCSIFFLLNVLHSTGLAFTNETDHEALLSIKALIPIDPLHVLGSWNHSIHFCGWYGVTCGLRHQRVTTLNLSSMGLVGSLSPHVSNLTFLKTIDLHNNSLHGIIPQDIIRLFRLQYLSLANNSFQGELPTNMTRCLDLRYINIGNNNLGGKIPADIDSLSNLYLLSLDRNHFTGIIPLSIGNLSSLNALFLGHNNLQGNIPSELGQLFGLEHLVLSSNNLFGVVPISLYNVSSIKRFFVSFNQLHGSLPQDLGFTLPNLQIFSVAFNKFDGPIPPSIANSSRLYAIEVQNNSFSGPLPMNLGTLHDLYSLNCFSNKLGVNNDKDNELENFFSSLSNCSKLQTLDLSDNHFGGLFPQSVANLSTDVTWFRMRSNYLSGTIPSGMGKLVNLQMLSLSNNFLAGSIPDSISKLSNLEKLFLEINNISGEIPSSIGNLTQLGSLTLRGNIIGGRIPLSLGNCTKLQQIYLQNNRLTGVIPPQIFSLPTLFLLLLDNNYLSGKIPQEAGNMKNLQQLYIADNKLYGEIPASLGSCQVLESLVMPGNFLEGSIPTTFMQLKGLQLLDLSHNNLSGEIPIFLGNLSIQFLNLSYNMLDGEVPKEGIFTNISAFSIVGNSQLCGGIDALQLPTCPRKALRGKRLEVKALVIILPLMVILFCLAIILFWTRRRRRQAPFTLPLQNQYPQLSYKELHQATNGFSSDNLIGQGRYGFVYKAILNFSEQIVAIKVLNLQERGANRSFITECEALKSIRHRNLVKILTAVSSIDFRGNDFKALVFDFMANGSLEAWLHPGLSEEHGNKNLSFIQRLNIAIDIASALDYLHNQCEMAIIHCDLKPSNVLLDDDLCAHVSDFGLTKILTGNINVSDHQQSSSIGIRGTIGYVAPEYGMNHEVSTQGDMFSYGVLLLEMFTGKRPTSDMLVDNINLRSYTKMFIPNHIMDVADPRLLHEVERSPDYSGRSSYTDSSVLYISLVSVFQVGVSCSSEYPNERMNARDSLTELHKIKNSFLKGQKC